jgi:GT2 family glycosyltransferase
MLSIIIPVFNQHKMTKECLTAVYAHTRDFEVIIVDNGSEPPLMPSVGEAYVVPRIRNETNLGFPAAVNQGIRAARGDIIILLNNDVIVTPGWAEKLTGALSEYDIVGPVTNYCAGLQRVQLPVYRDEQELNGNALEWAESHAGETQKVGYVIGFCMAFRKSLFDEIGYFDESLWPCSGEEIDFCMRARQKGHKVGIVKDIYVHHEGSQTFKDMDVDYGEICERNDKHLIEKWGAGVMNQEVESEVTGLWLNLGCGYRKFPGYVNIDNRAEVNPDLVCDVTLELPYPDSSVDGVRAYDFLEHIPRGLVIEVIEEIYRVLKPDGIFEAFTPSTDGRGAWQDPTHVSYWNKNSWAYYSDPDCRKLYGIKANFHYAILEDVITSVKENIIHTHVIGKAVK